ncbi:MAG: tRNA pseudouridine(38-40) synthase TruA [Holosporaceae bacterium]|nr:tRNA pseudouridine(38-40) synthase TruA [Holosporaceae bacterium]
MRYRIKIEYDGTPFHGWQRQDGMDTVQQRLEEAAFPFTKVPVVLHVSGRTDAGVHALGQIAHFDSPEDLNCFRLQECMNAHLKDVPIGILEIEKVSDKFHARLGAIERYYCYKILNRRAKACIDTSRVWWVSYQLDTEKMHTVAQHLIGKHDFSAFRAAGCQSNSPIKTLNNISITRTGDLILVNVAAKSFLYHQVRNTVGSLVWIGRGYWSERDFLDIFDACDRTRAGPTAPACGLYFIGTKYSDE